MQSRLVWTMGVFVVGTLLTAVGAALSGYRHPSSADIKAIHAPSAPPGTSEIDAPTETSPEAVRSIRVHVVGAVREAGVYVIPRSARVQDAMRKAGGATEEADLEAVNLADMLKDGEQIRIPYRSERRAEVWEENANRTAVRSGARSGRYPFTRSSPRKPKETAPAPVIDETRPLDLNKASVEELQRLPGIGPTLAQRIVAYRRQHGPFQHPNEITNIPGISIKAYFSLRPYLVAR